MARPASRAAHQNPSLPPSVSWDLEMDQLGVLRELLSGAEILPSQLPTARAWTPELRLAAGVLGQAMADIRWRRADGADSYEVNAALRWVRKDDTSWPFSFLRVCELLQLDPDWVRGRVARWMRQGRDKGRSAVRLAA